MATGADTEPQALVAAIGRGGEGARAAEADLCRRFAPRIRLYGLRHLRDRELARDLVQMALLGVLEAVRGGRVREPEHLERFILGICRNVATRLKQKGARHEATDPEAFDALLVPTQASEEVDGRALAGCMEKLESRARKVVTLAFREDRSAEEIAAAVGTSAGNVRVIRHRALAALRLCLDGADQKSTAPS